MGERREVPQRDRVVTFDPEPLAHRREDLSLLDRVNPQVGLQVQVHVQQVGRVPGHPGHDRHHRLGDLVDGLSRSRWHGCHDRLRQSLGHLSCRRRERRGDRSRRSLRRADIHDAQTALHDLELRARVPGSGVQPALPGCLVGHPVREAQLEWRTVAAVRRWDPAQQRHGDLRAEARGETQRVVHGVLPAVRQVERTQLGVDLTEVRDRRHDRALQRLHRYDVLDPGPHRVTGEALRVRDHDAVGVGPEHPAQRADLG